MSSRDQVLESLLSPAVNSLGYELILAERTGSHENGVLRLYIDGPLGISVDDCSRVSRQVSALLDVEDPISGHYSLEVSSPGVDRPLVSPDHYRSYVGHKVKITTARHIEGRRRFGGHLEEVTEEGVIVDVDGEAYELPFAEIESGKLNPDLTKSEK